MKLNHFSFLCKNPSDIQTITFSEDLKMLLEEHIKDRPLSLLDEGRWASQTDGIYSVTATSYFRDDDL